jgi:diguanylate cyclase (GGDEF)-like protein
MTENANALATAAWFDSCPDGLLILAPDQSVVAVNSTLCKILKREPEELVGRTRQEMPAPELDGLFHPDGRLQLYTHGIPSCQLKIQSREIPESGGLTLSSFTDVSEYEALREENTRLLQQVEELTLTDELTGLANERAFHRVLGSQVTRSRRYTNPLCLAVVEIEAEVADADLARELILAVSHFLRDRLRWVDLIARWSNDRFMLILPETSAQDANDLLDKVRNEFVGSSLPDNISHLPVHLQIGLAEWQKGNDARMLMKRALEALVEAKEAEANPTP